MPGSRLVLRLALSAALSGAFLLARAWGNDPLAVATLAALLGLAVPASLGAGRRAALTGALALTAILLVMLPRAAAAFLAVLPSTVQLLLAWHFGATLRPGREPLILAYSRWDVGEPSPELVRYARRLTGIWTLVFLALAALNAAPVLGAWPDAGTAAWLTAALLAALFLAEHAVRSRILPQYGLASPRRTLRAIWLANTARHAG